ncbi:translation factor SUA5 [Tistlia consotensis]|uniref:Threonylcarbamoyl-AMP synthase n=1 Tax=Tistlia consotensis USBA 355 TaxID=560819 RepID=A0A1Y6BC57_9PROT|nr:L-threonylcarbamoyladenylate synthase [Tistlia consotensis]SME97192.1 translation factor SUA5 [Tistlia consotensis USBA 355]SNR56601.1 translation factor SUA5 [Tistlia consotensis]
MSESESPNARDGGTVPRILPASPAAIAEAAALLRAGRLVVFPTETVYGLGGDATDAEAVAAIFAAKGRPRFNPLISHLPDLESAEREAVFDARARRLAERFWPGPLTLVLPRRPDSRIALLCSAGLDSVALRVPAQPVARALLRAVGRPVAAPSANRSGRISPTRAEHAAAELGDRVALYLDDGPTAVGLESTVVSLLGPEPLLLRPGGLPLEELEAELGPLGRVAAEEGGAARLSPGLLTSHYAPTKPLRLEATAVAPDEALLAFGPEVPEGAAQTINLSPAGDTREAAAGLFEALRALDAGPGRAIAAMAVPAEGLGLAIRDRLARAAAPRG